MRDHKVLPKKVLLMFKLKNQLDLRSLCPFFVRAVYFVCVSQQHSHTHIQIARICFHLNKLFICFTLIYVHTHIFSALYNFGHGCFCILISFVLHVEQKTLLKVRADKEYKYVSLKSTNEIIKYTNENKKKTRRSTIWEL